MAKVRGTQRSNWDFTGWDFCEEIPIIKKTGELRILCSCPASAEYNNRSWRDETTMSLTKSKDGQFCDFCRHAVYKDYGTTEYKQRAQDVSCDQNRVKRKYEKEKRSHVGNWHKIDKLK